MISSGNLDTLVALTVIVVILLGFQSVLDYLRHRIFTILGGRVAARLGQPVFEAAVETTLRHGPGAATGAMRDLGDLRVFIASGAIALPMDLAFSPIFLLVLFMLHPLYGVIGLIGAATLTIVAVATELLARRPASRANRAAGAVHVETAAAIRSAEVITAMGMLPAVAARWRRAAGRRARQHRARSLGRQGADRVRQGAARRAADRHRLRRRDAGHRPRGLGGHHHRRRGDQRAAAAAVRAPDRRLAAVAGRLRRPRPHPRRAGGRRDDALAHAGGGASARGSSSTA